MYITKSDLAFLKSIVNKLDESDSVILVDMIDRLESARSRDFVKEKRKTNKAYARSSEEIAKYYSK